VVDERRRREARPKRPAFLWRGRSSGWATLIKTEKVTSFWRQIQTGDVVVWLMNGATTLIAAGVPTAWQIMAVADINGDRKADLIWRQTQTGDVAAWLWNR
jgi:hypothetical protein